MAKILNEILREARAMGFTAEHTNGQHIRLTRANPDATVVISTTLGDPRAAKNVRADLRRASNPAHPFGKPTGR